MAYQNSTNPSLSDDEDDQPLVFRRSSTATKQNQSNADVKKSSTQRSDGQPRRQVHSSNGVNSSVQKDKMAPSTKASPGKNPATTPKELPEQNKSASIKEENASIADNSDSDDDKPINARLASRSNNVKQEDSDDEDNKPLSSRLSKSNVGTSGSKPCDSKDRKPLASTFQRNGSSTNDKGKISSLVSSKRPLEKGNYSEQSSVKKPKIADPSTSVKNKQESAKKEPKADDDDMTLSQRMKKTTLANKPSQTKKIVSKVGASSIQKKIVKGKKPDKFSKYSKSSTEEPSSKDGSKKWTYLEHNGVIFPPPYKPHGLKMLYNGKPVVLTPEQEEVATMYAVMIDTDYVQKQVFRDNFWNDWRKLLGKNHVIQKLDACDFKPIYDWYQKEKEKKKQMTTEEKKAMKEEKMKQEEKYMWATLDGVKEKVGNFRVEPPGLFRGRGEHPKSGKLKRRIRPSDVTINIGKDASVPECPIPGERWKEIRHDNTVTWLAFWNDPINPKEFKYVFLAASSSLKGQSDMQKYEKARMLKDYIGNIRAAYTKDFTSRDSTRRQIAVATYLIDKLALRAGNEKEDDEAETVGCCTLKVENVKAIAPSSLEFNFLGKDSIKYENTVEVDPAVYKEIKKFQEGKEDSDDLFDELDTSKLNSHLKELMPGLTAKVFRTYNASITLDNELNQETAEGDVIKKKVFYDTANKKVAIICNHQRAVSKSHASQMDKLKDKLSDLQSLVKELNTDLVRARNGKPPLKDADGKQKRNLTPEALQKKIADANTKIEKLEIEMQSKDDMKTIALGTSKINYLDPRITVAWCKRHEVPIEKIFQKSLLGKFAWAMDVDPDFRF